MAWPEVGAMVKIVGTMDAQQYADILENALLPAIERVSSEPELPPSNHLIFQQDNISQTHIKAGDEVVPRRRDQGP